MEKKYKTLFPLTNTVSPLIAFLLCLLFSQTAFSQKTIILNTAFGSPISDNTQSGFADQMISEAFSRIGYQLETVHMPAERALINANRGIDDGDLARVAGLQTKYPNLIQVPEFIMIVDMVLFSKNKPDFIVKGWNSVASHSLAIISGWKIMEKNFGKLGSKVEIIKTDNVDQSFAVLENDRVDFVAYSNWSGLNYVKTHKISNVTLLSPPLASPKFYVYLHKKHKKIVPLLADAIKQIKNDGTLDRIYNRTLLPYLASQKKQQE